MNRGVLINDIELGFSPMSAFHFGLLIRDKKFYHNVEDSHLYIIAQRKEITFHNFNFKKNFELNFDIIQEDNPVIIKCRLSLLQKNIYPNIHRRIELRLHDRKNTVDKKSDFPFNGTQAFSIQETDEITGKTNIIVWYTPDKLFQNHWKGNITVDFSTDYKNMLEYNVHYVGKSTEQNICKRLSNHSTFQQILTNENTLSFGNIPSNEIMLLLLRIKDNNSIVSWGKESTSEEISDFINNYNLPSDKSISLDAEKALIKYLQPQYNKVLYKTFPSNDDLINNDFHNTFLYAISDPIILNYNTGIIRGGKFMEDRDYIEIGRNEK